MMDTEVKKKKINEFLDRKKIEHPFLRECVEDFINGHEREFGDIVSTEDLFARLEENLDEISFAGYNGTGVGGEYVKRDRDGVIQNKILIYEEESSLEMSDLYFNIYTPEDQQETLRKVDENRSRIKASVIHELTHAGYTKPLRSGLGEQHIFTTTFMGTGEKKQIGKTHYIEPIVNFISSKISGNNYAYEFETKAIQMLADKIGERGIVEAAWDSDEMILKNAYTELVKKNNGDGEKSYQSFEDDMLAISVHGRNGDYWDYYKKSIERLEHIEQLLEGKTSLSYGESKYRPSNKAIGEIKPLQPMEEPLEFGNKNGYEDVDNSSIPKSFFSRAIQYVKEKFMALKRENNKGRETDGG